MTKNIYFIQEKPVNINKTVKCKYYIHQSLADRSSLNGLQVIRLHYITADDVQKYMTVSVITESIIKS